MGRKINNLTILKRIPKIKEIDLHDGESPIKIEINPSEDKKEKIANIILNNIKEDEETIDLSNANIFLNIVPLITDIELSKEEQSDFMDFLFKDPSKDGIKLRDGILEVVTNIMEEMFNQIEDTAKELKLKDVNINELTNNKIENN
jgi:hypothetical protein